MPVRRRRRWPWVMTVLTVLTLGCCCGCPAYFGGPISEQYPATAALPAQVAGFELRDDASSKLRVQELKAETRTKHLFAEDSFAGLYRDPDGKQLTVFGSTGFRFSPEKDLKDEITWLTGKYDLTDVRPVDTGVRGAYEQCGTGRSDGTAIVLCAWADHGSLGAALFDRRSVEESADLSGELRTSLVKRG